MAMLSLHCLQGGKGFPVSLRPYSTRLFTSHMQTTHQRAMLTDFNIAHTQRGTSDKTQAVLRSRHRQPLWHHCLQGRKGFGVSLRPYSTRLFTSHMQTTHQRALLTDFDIAHTQHGTSDKTQAVLRSRHRQPLWHHCLQGGKGLCEFL